MIGLLIGLGAAGELIVRTAVGAREVGVWVADGAYFTTLGILSLLVAPIIWWSEGWTAAGAVAAGAAVSVVLFLATRAFLLVAAGWPAFVRHTRELYAARDRIPLAAAIVLSILAATGEELFWRGVVQATWAGALTPLAGAALAWALNVAVTIPNRSLTVTVGTAVGALAWGGLALVTGGVLAAIVCHVTWTVAMLVFPPPLAKTHGAIADPAVP